MRNFELILYRGFEDDTFDRMAYIANHFEDETAERAKLVDDMYTCLNRLVTIAGRYGLSGNLWNCYLTHLLTTCENAFSLSSEKVGALTGSINDLALHDLKIFREAYHMDWGRVEEKLGVHFIKMMMNYQAPDESGAEYSSLLRTRIKDLNEKLSSLEHTHDMYDELTTFYKEFGVGKYGLHRAFKVSDHQNEALIQPVTRTSSVLLKDIVGYELQKEKLIANTESFVKGRQANNLLLYGDSGTGKSTSIKAIVNEYYKDGLRMIEIYKHQFRYIQDVMAEIKNRNYKFIIYMDDLSFEEFETDYKYLKAIIEGGLEKKPDNMLIYATSNRRHLIKETWDDRKKAANDVHGADSMQEKLSLSTRFGESIYYGKPAKEEYLNIVRELAKKHGIVMDDGILCEEAMRWEMRGGGLSGRTAQQFINHLL
ncbi:MAG: ATP-binding protein [Lachnospiraceae bacterium]|nr:ATP-binding protein [Lachnospiraceae bacterium]